MNKRTIMVGAVGGMTVGAVVPWLWGNYATFSVASVLWGMIGGFLGIWFAAWASKHIGI